MRGSSRLRPIRASPCAPSRACRTLPAGYMEERENNLVMMRAVLEMASDLGVELVKVFAAWPGLCDDEEAVAMYAP